MYKRLGLFNQSTKGKIYEQKVIYYLSFLLVHCLLKLYFILLIFDFTNLFHLSLFVFLPLRNVNFFQQRGINLSCVRTCVVVAEERPRVGLTTSFSKLFSGLGLSPRAVSTSFGCRVNVAICLQVSVNLCYYISMFSIHFLSKHIFLFLNKILFIIYQCSFLLITTILSS